jgi:hypothetical protein
MLFCLVSQWAYDCEYAGIVFPLTTFKKKVWKSSKFSVRCCLYLPTCLFFRWVTLLFYIQNTGHEWNKTNHILYAWIIKNWDKFAVINCKTLASHTCNYCNIIFLNFILLLCIWKMHFYKHENGGSQTLWEGKQTLGVLITVCMNFCVYTSRSQYDGIHMVLRTKDGWSNKREMNEIMKVVCIYEHDMNCEWKCVC